jgi:hypothetical protein
MKLPTLAKLGKYHRFNLTPRHYDPVKEEIEQRTEAIRRELEEEGILNPGQDFNPGYHSGHRSSIRGSFRARSKVKSSSLLDNSGLLRLFIFVVLLAGLGGYLYLGNEVLYYLLYLTIGVGMWLMLTRLKRNNKK